MAIDQYPISNAKQQHGKGGEVVVVMVPLPMQGHLNQLLHLSRLIATNNITVHFVGTTAHNHQAMLRVQGWNPLAVSNIHFHQLPTPPFPCPPPDPDSRIKFPSHLQPLLEATTKLREPVAALLRDLSARCRRLVVIHDSLMASVVQDFSALPNAESYTFHSVSACAIFFFKWENMGRPELRSNLFSDVDDHKVDVGRQLPSFDGCFTAEFKRFAAAQYEYAKYSSGRIYNTCRLMEDPFLDLLRKEEERRNKKQWALGPFNPVELLRNNGGRGAHSGRHRCLRWLDRQEPGSVIFVSFGTTTTFRVEQIREIAAGLEKSGHKFIWVLREADKGVVLGDDEVAAGGIRLPEGFEERVERRRLGMVVRGWAPQLEILGHSATGGFMSHCGWNSCMESISMGVPVAAWPMHSDQPTNTVLITRVLRVGLVVREFRGADSAGALVAAAAVERVVRRLMGSEEGAEIRKRAVELGGIVRKSVSDRSGGSRLELNSFIAHISR